MEQYNAKFAEVYDIFMDNTDYDAWANYIISLLPTDFPKGARIFECGCGTGALTLRLNKAGYDVTGSDISRDMLEVAAEKSRRCGQKTKFICMDMRRIELHRPVDCIIAACDCVNYLTSREDVEKFLLTAFNGLRPGGIQGGSFVYMLLMAALMVFFGIFSAGFMKQKERAQKHDEG